MALPHDTEVVGTAPTAQDELDVALAAPNGNPPNSSDDLADQVEALLITSSRPLTLERIGQVLGLIAPDATDPSADAPPVNDAAVAPPADPPVGVTRPRRKPRRAAADGPTPQERIAAAIDFLNGIYARTGRTFRIEPMAGGYRAMTLPRYGAIVEALRGGQSAGKLSRAAVETLAIIAYKQPITRGKLEAVRGCGCGEVLKSLMDRRLVTIAGRAEELGRPLLYATTKPFLDAFGLASLKDLPSSAELK